MFGAVDTTAITSLGTDALAYVGAIAAIVGTVAAAGFGIDMLLKARHRAKQGA